MKIQVSVARQLLTLFDDAGRVLREYRVSTGKAGVGEVFGSFRSTTPGGFCANTAFPPARPASAKCSAVFRHRAVDT